MKNRNFFLSFLFLIALFLRLYQLSQIPSGFHSDEAALGYNAYSLLLTGKDEYGQKLPLSLRSFDDYKPALYSYLAIPSIKFFGLNELAVRLPSALFGALTVVVLYFFVRQLTHHESISLFSAFLMALSPWHLNLSRTASEAILGLFFTLLGFCFFFLSNSRRKFFLLLAILSWILAMLSYHLPRFFLPIILFIILFFNFSKEKKKNLLTFLFILALGIFLTLKMGGGARIKQLSLFGNAQGVLKLAEQIREENPLTSPLITRFFHNKITNSGLNILENYGRYLSLDFLFFKGAQPLRAQIPDVGVLLLVEIILLPLGLAFFLRKNLRQGIFLIVWLFLGLLPAALTVDETPNLYRSLIVLPALNLFSAAGAIQLKELLIPQKRVVKTLVITLLVASFFWSFFYFWHQYTVHQKTHHPWYRHHGYKELVQFLNQEKVNYDQVFVSKYYGSPYIFFLFYTPFNPADYQRLGSPRDFDFRGFDHYLFFPLDCPSQSIEAIKREGKILFLDAGICDIPQYATVVKTINWEDNSPMFRALKINQPAVAIDYLEKKAISK